MKNIVVLWDNIVDMDGDAPFDKEVWNEEYELFTGIAESEDIRLLLSHYTEYSDAKVMTSWFFDGEEWNIIENIDPDGIYDKFKYDQETMELKQRMQEEVGILNVPELERICKDKLETGRVFEAVPETRKATEENIRGFLDQDGRAVVKPRYDHGGRGIQIIEGIDQLETVDSEENVVQRFVDASEGIPGTDYSGAHDLRAYMVDDQMVMGLIRQPDEGGLISNVAQGGSQELFSVDEFGEEAVNTVMDVADEFERFFPALYSVDLMYDEDGEPFIVEVNSKPGLSYYGDEVMKERIMELVRKLSESFHRV